MTLNVWKVIHKKDDIETVYLVSACSRREAETIVLDSLFDRTHPITWTPEELANDPFGLKVSTGFWTNYALCKQHVCSVNATLYQRDVVSTRDLQAVQPQPHNRSDDVVAYKPRIKLVIVTGDTISTSEVKAPPERDVRRGLRPRVHAHDEQALHRELRESYRR